MNGNGGTAGKQGASNGRAKAKSGKPTPATPNDRNGSSVPAPAKRRRVYKLVRKLRPHPLQAVLFQDLPDVELEQLADDLEQNGQIDDVEVVHGNLVICGWQRTRAMRLKGQKRVRCWLRDDLSALGDEAIERRMIEDNFHRRQLTPLDKARCFVRLRELERSKPRRNGHLKGDLRDYLAKLFGFSGRNLERWAKLLNTPVEIQRAVPGRLKLEMGVAVAGLPKDTQEEIARAIRKGVEPKQAVAEHVMPRRSQPAPDTLYDRFYRSLAHAVTELGTRAKGVNMKSCGSHLPTLRKGRKMISNLIAGIEATTDRH